MTASQSLGNQINRVAMQRLVPLRLLKHFLTDWLISLGCKNEWAAKRLREGCLKDRDSSNPFTPPRRPGAGAKSQWEALVSSRTHTSAARPCTHLYVHSQVWINACAEQLWRLCALISVLWVLGGISVREPVQTGFWVWSLVFLHYSKKDDIHTQSRKDRRGNGAKGTGGMFPL